ncbi:MAG: hypothetical protein C0446_03325 [Chitinophaga sp.]|nr:hypothetical protein [Chitinophaga sp.]
MSKRLLLFSLFFSISLFAFSQQLKHVLLSTNGKARYEVSAGNPLLIINDSGKIQSIVMEPMGEIKYDENTFPHKLGEQNLEFNYDGRLVKIGNTIIQYDLNGRVDKIGDLVLSYNYQQQIASIGGYNIRYNTNKTVDQIGVFKVQYNYNGQVLMVEQSKGLILLQLNFAK